MERDKRQPREMESGSRDVGLGSHKKGCTESALVGDFWKTKNLSLEDAVGGS